MDIAGAKALKKRLGAQAAEHAPPTPAADVHEDAPPVYQWTGVSHPDAESPPADPDDAPLDGRVSRFRRLALILR